MASLAAARPRFASACAVLTDLTRSILFVPRPGVLDGPDVARLEADAAANPAAARARRVISVMYASQFAPAWAALASQGNDSVQSGGARSPRGGPKLRLAPRGPGA